MHSENIIANSHILPCVQEYIKIHQANKVYIDIAHRFQKQTFRNRFYIATAHGALPLIVPVCQGKTQLLLKEVKINYDQPWQRTHLRTIKSAYGSAPYFIYFMDEFERIYETQFEYLYELNNALYAWLFKQFKTQSQLSNIVDGDHYIIKIEGKIDDLEVSKPTTDIREIFQTDNANLIAEPYSQVFIDKTGFIPNLSILDFLFNCGNKL